MGDRTSEYVNFDRERIVDEIYKLTEKLYITDGSRHGDARHGDGGLSSQDTGTEVCLDKKGFHNTSSRRCN